MLVLSFSLLSQRRLTAMVLACALQSWALAAAACWQATLQQAPSLIAAAIVTLAIPGLALPIRLHQIAVRQRTDRETDPPPGILPGMALGVAIVTLAVLVVLPTTLPTQATTREDLALALSIILLGLLVMVSRKTALPQVLGFLSMQNGLVLAVLGLANVPLLVEIAVAGQALLACALLGAFDRLADPNR